MTDREKELIEEVAALRAKVAYLENQKEFLRQETVEAVAKANRLEERFINMVPVNGRAGQ